MRLLLLLLLAASTLLQSSLAWTTTLASRGKSLFQQHYNTRSLLHYDTRLYSSTEENKVTATKLKEEEEEEWEYLEYEELQESDFVNSEWLVGTVLDNSPKKIKETWVRCLVGNDARSSSQPCVWGDGSQGKWSFDRASQYFSLSKEHFYGKEIWAGMVDDYYYLQGTVRGWTFVTPAEVLGQWQAKRLGVDPEEAGTAPWFEEEEDGSDDESDDESDDDVKSKAAASETKASSKAASDTETPTKEETPSVEKESQVTSKMASQGSLSDTNETTPIEEEDTKPTTEENKKK